MIIATLPNILDTELIYRIIESPLVDAVRFNTGVSSPNTPYEDLITLTTIAPKTKTIWIDLKCRQLRVEQWCAPFYTEVELNHEIELELPAEIHFRGGDWSEIGAVRGNKVYLKNPPNEAIGKGQAVNISSRSLKVKGYFTEKDIDYIKAAERLGFQYFMLSFYEGSEDVDMLNKQLKNPSKVHIGLKIESRKGIEAVEELKQDMSLISGFPHEHNLTLVVARDDLMISLKGNPVEMLDVYTKCLETDKNAIVASQFCSGLKHSGICASDISDIHLLYQMGYKNFLWSDEMCIRHFDDIALIWQLYEKRREKMKKGEK